jgi:6-phosphogluconolactonase (cycloisomerase 2 family)
MKRQGFAAGSIVLLSIISLLALLGPGEVTGASVRVPDVTGGLPSFVAAYYDGIGLDGANSLAVSPDGQHLYVTSWRDAVAVFSRDGVSGELAFVEMVRDDSGGVDGLEGAHSVAPSPDGSHVYVAGYGDNALAVFSRDGASGALTFVEMQQDGVGGVDGLDGASAVAVSPDGSHVYITGGGDDAVAVFSRDGETGVLAFVEMQQDGVGGVDGLGGATSVALSPDGNHLYVAGAADDAVAVFGRDGASGALTFIEMQKNYSGGVYGLGGVASVAVSPDGSHLYTASQFDDAVVVFGRDEDSGGLTLVEVQRDNVGGVDGLEWADAVAVSPDGAYVSVASGVDDAVTVFGRDEVSGALTFVEMQQDELGDSPWVHYDRAVTFSPDGAHVYVANAQDDALAAFSQNAPSGALTFVERHEDDDGGAAALAFAGAITLSPDGDHVYVSAATDSAVSVFGRDASRGTLTFAEIQRDGFDGVDGLAWASSVAVSPDGDHVYATGSDDHAVAVFSRDGASGALTFVEVQQDGVGPVDGLEGASAVALSPAGDHVYVAGYDENALAVFSRDGASGALDFVEVQRDNVGGADCLERPLSVTISPDGKNVYAASAWDDSVQVFGRDGTSGILTPLQCKVDGYGSEGLDGAASVAVSPDGHNLYATGKQEDALAVFDRDPATGLLDFVQVKRDGLAGVDGLYFADTVAVSPDGSRVYVTGHGDNALAVFDRDASTGELTYVGLRQDNTAGVHGLDGAAGVTVSPDGDHLYVAGEWDDAVALFAVSAGNRVYLPLVVREAE